MKYIRTIDGIYEPTNWQCDLSGEMILVKADNKFGNDTIFVRNIMKQADTIEELVQIGDIVFYWSSSDDKEHCVVISYEADLNLIKYNVITKLLIPVGEDYKCVAKGYPSFNLIKDRRYLVSKGELELL